MHALVSRPRRGSLAAAVTCVLALAGPGTAAAIVTDVHSVDGPSADVVAVEDAAMSEDGSGGLVYLKRVEKRAHVFAVSFRDGAWGSPVRVDTGQNFDSSWARIGAGDGGRLVVTWVQEFGVESDRMFSATLDPGAKGFQAPVPIDLNVGEATSTFPDLAMNRGGQAYLVYRVVTDISSANPPGYVGADTRVARYSGRLWSVIGTPVDRSISTPVRQPTAASAPKVGIDVQGGGLVAWQEPNDEFVDRVWARRLFGSTFGIPLQVSPSSWDGAPLRGPADAFSLDVSGFGQGAIAFRQQPGESGKLTAPRAMVAEIPDIFSEKSGAFEAPHLADGGVRDGLGVPAVGVEPRGLYAAGFGSGPAALLGSGDDIAATKVERLDDGGSEIEGEPLVDIAETGAAVAAWRELEGGAGKVGVQERRADKLVEPTTLSAPRGGAIGQLAMGGSGLGDALIAWEQGSGANGQVAAAVVDAPPDPFLVLLPEGWQSRKATRVAWDRTSNAIGGVRYSVSVDDEPVLENRRALNATLGPDAIEDGKHRIQIFAVDSAGQETGSRTGSLWIDRTPPGIDLRRRGPRVTVSFDDGTDASSVKKGAISVNFGDGTRIGGAGGGAGGVISVAKKKKKKGKGGKTRVVRRSHTYKESGTFVIRVHARDKAGNSATFKKRVRIG